MRLSSFEDLLNMNRVSISFESTVKVSNEVAQICPYVETISLHKYRSTIDTSVSVNYNSSTKVRVKKWSFTYYIFLVVIEEFYIYVNPLII